MIKQKFAKLTKSLGAGLKQELHETKQIPGQIKRGNYKEAGEQAGDIGKMLLIVSIWILPAGAIISAFIIKYSKKIRPSSFQPKMSQKDEQ